MADTSTADPSRPTPASDDGGTDAGQQGTPAAPVPPAAPAATGAHSGASHSIDQVSTGAGGSTTPVSAPASPPRTPSAPVGVPATTGEIPAATSTPLAVPGVLQVPTSAPSTAQQPATITGLPSSMTLSVDAHQAVSMLVMQLQTASSGGSIRQDSSFLCPTSSPAVRPASAASTATTMTLPATLRDLHRGSTFADTTDGLARVIPLLRLSDAELRRLSSLAGGDATVEVLHPGLIGWWTPLTSEFAWRWNVGS